MEIPKGRKAKLDALKEIQDALAAEKQSDLETLKGLLEEECAKTEYTLQDVVDAFFAPVASAPATGRKLPPKYRNPNNEAETWTGQGSAPKWLRKAAEIAEEAEWKGDAVKAWLNAHPDYVIKVRV